MEPGHPEAQTGTRVASAGGSRVAFFGGSFDPPHLGHLAVARAARDAFRLDAVLFAPVGAQPLKPEGSTASFDDRLAMTRLAIEGEPGFQVSLLDAPRADAPLRPNYTIDALETLRTVLPADAELFCLMGADSLLGLRYWHRAAEVPFAAGLIVASRPGQPVQDFRAVLPEGLFLAHDRDERWGSSEVEAFSITDRSGRRAPFYLLPRLHFPVSASAVRAQVSAADGEQAGGKLLPDAVLEFIRERRLYKE